MSGNYGPPIDPPEWEDESQYPRLDEPDESGPVPPWRDPEAGLDDPDGQMAAELWWSLVEDARNSPLWLRLWLENDLLPFLEDQADYDQSELGGPMVPNRAGQLAAEAQEWARVLRGEGGGR